MDDVTGACQYDFSSDGMLLYVQGSPSARQLVWVHSDGTEGPVVRDSSVFLRPRLAQDAQPRLSQDGRRLALRLLGESAALWLFDVERQTISRLTSEKNPFSPVWSPDGQRIAFVAMEGKSWRLMLRASDGTGDGEQLARTESHMAINAWTPDGRSIAVTVSEPESKQRDVYLVPLVGDRRLEPLLANRFDESDASPSPDGRWLAYSSAETGDMEVYARSFAGAGGKWRVSMSGGGDPMWSPDGKAIFYHTDETMFAVPVFGGDSLRLGSPRVLFRGFYELGSGAGGRNYDYDPIQRRFVVVKVPGRALPPNQILFVANWFEALKTVTENP